MLLKSILIQSNDLESGLLLLFIRNLSCTCRLRFLLNGLKLPFSTKWIVYESLEICSCINAENLQDTTTGSPGGDTHPRVQKIFTICLLVL